jgi:protein tyrosine/serine phosphatase
MTRPLRCLPLLLTSCINFHPVEEGRVYRSAQPDAASMRSWVEEHGIRTVVQLRGSDPTGELAEVIDHHDVEVVRIPLTAYRYPSRAQLVGLWDAFAAAEYPLLLHCRAGADRTGLAAAVYVLWRTGDLDRARAQLSLWYGHTGYGTSRLGRVFEMYSRWHGRMDFRRWASSLYHPPPSFAAREPRTDELDDR